MVRSSKKDRLLFQQCTLFTIFEDALNDETGLIRFIAYAYELRLPDIRSKGS